MAKKYPRVNIQVDANYFHNVFEPNRREMQRKLGISNLSTRQFTAYLAKPQLSNSRMDLKFAPKTRKRGKLSNIYFS